MVDWLSLSVPLAYLGILIGSLATFSSLYRKRKARMFLRQSTITPLHPSWREGHFHNNEQHKLTYSRVLQKRPLP